MNPNIKALLKKSDAELEMMLDLIQKQIAMASKQSNTEALTRLQSRESEAIQARAMRV